MLPLLLGACVSANTPGDLALESVQVVDWRDQAEMPGPGASFIVGLVGSQAALDAGQSVTGGEKWSRPLLRVEFTSKTNLAKFVKEKHYNLGSHAFFCDRPETSPYLSFPDVFWRGSLLGLHEPDPIEQQAGATAASLTYYFFIDVAAKKIVSSNLPQDGFDLHAKPEDVCFSLRGGDGAGFGYRSNTVMIPEAAIEAALR